MLDALDRFTPRAKGTERAPRNLLLEPHGDRGMAIRPRGNLLRVAELHLRVLDGHASTTQCLANSALAGLNVLLHVRMRTEHYVDGVLLERSTYHRFDGAGATQSHVACPGPPKSVRTSARRRRIEREGNECGLDLHAT